MCSLFKNSRFIFEKYFDFWELYFYCGIDLPGWPLDDSSVRYMCSNATFHEQIEKYAYINFATKLGNYVDHDHDIILSFELNKYMYKQIKRD